ncbi:unnamed protein product, partial [Scytosiphon promiscuus]
MSETVETLRHVPEGDKPPVFRIIREWHEKNMFKGLESFAATGAGAGVAGGAAGAPASSAPVDYSPYHQAPPQQAAVSASPALMPLPTPNTSGVIHLGLKAGDTYGSAYPAHSSNGNGGGAAAGPGTVAPYAPSFEQQNTGTSPPAGGMTNGGAVGGGGGVGG